MNIEQLSKLAQFDFSNFIGNENNIKHHIVIPFLQSFGHRDLELEHAAQGSRIDVNIGNKIIIETKALHQNLNIHIKQLNEYCNIERPVLAILTNGKDFRLYSPHWRQQRNFADTIIYSFDIKDLENIQILNRLEKILGFSN